MYEHLVLVSLTVVQTMLGDAAECAAILRRAETDQVFYQRLVKACAKRAANFVPEHEATAIRASVARAQLTAINGGLKRL